MFEKLYGLGCDNPHHSPAIFWYIYIASLSMNERSCFIYMYDNPSMNFHPPPYSQRPFQQNRTKTNKHNNPIQPSPLHPSSNLHPSKMLNEAKTSKPQPQHPPQPENPTSLNKSPKSRSQGKPIISTLDSVVPIAQYVKKSGNGNYPCLCWNI